MASKRSKSPVNWSDEDKQSDKSTSRRIIKPLKSSGLSSDDENRPNKMKAGETPKHPISLAASSDDEKRTEKTIKRKAQRRSEQRSDSSDNSDEPKISKEERRSKENTSANDSPKGMHSTTVSKTRASLFIYPGRTENKTRTRERRLRGKKLKLELKLTNEKDDEIGVCQVKFDSLRTKGEGLSQSTIESQVEYVGNPHRIHLKLSKGNNDSNDDSDSDDDSDKFKWHLDRVSEKLFHSITFERLGSMVTFPVLD